MLGLLKLTLKTGPANSVDYQSTTFADMNLDNLVAYYYTAIAIDYMAVAHKASFFVIDNVVVNHHTASFFAVNIADFVADIASFAVIDIVAGTVVVVPANIFAVDSGIAVAVLESISAVGTVADFGIAVVYYLLGDLGYLVKKCSNPDLVVLVLNYHLDDLVHSSDCLVSLVF